MVNPITPQMLRDDWTDHPTLTKSDKAVLESLPDSQLQQVLDEALLSYEEVWHNMLDEVRGIATDRLLASVPTADSAPEGTLDECSNCGLPITRQGAYWADDIMGGTTCPAGDGGTHSPKQVLAKYLLALQEGSKDKTPMAGNRDKLSLLFVLSVEGSNREDGNVYYSTFLLFNEPESRRHEIHTALESLLHGKLTTDGVSFQLGNNQQADDLWDDQGTLIAAIGAKGFDVYEVGATHVVREE